MIRMNADVFAALLIGLAFIFTHIGSFYQYSKREGTHDLKRELKTTRVESEKVKEILYSLTHHATFKTPSVKQSRRLESVKG
jgi:hypothetical protein